MMGEVTLMDKKPATQMRNPNTPWGRVSKARGGGLTVTKTPHPNVHSSVVELKRLRMAGISPAIGMRGTMATMDRRLEYHASATAELSTTSSEALMTSEWMAVVHEERTPKMTPRLHPHERGSDLGIGR